MPTAAIFVSISVGVFVAVLSLLFPVFQYLGATESSKGSCAPYC
jgi:hypothetical protein